MSKICHQWAHLELFNARRTQVMDPHHCGETEATKDRLGLCRDPFMLAEAFGHLTHVLLNESKQFGLLACSAGGIKGSITMVWLTHPCTVYNTHQKWITMPISLSIHTLLYLSRSSLMRNPFDRKYSAKESQDGSSLTNFLTSERFIILPSLFHFSCDSFALKTSCWIQPSSASRKHILLRWCSILVWGSWQIKQWTSFEGFLHTAKELLVEFSVTWHNALYAGMTFTLQYWYVYTFCPVWCLFSQAVCVCSYEKQPYWR